MGKKQVQRLGSMEQHDASRELQVHRGLCTELRVDTYPIGDWEAVKGFKEWGGG